jgi:uncharacterized protein Yka (UPF0111/DUF47 family)
VYPRTMKITMADINSVLQALVPKDKRFYPLFEKSAESLCEMATTMRKGLEGNDVERISMLEAIHRFEKQGDEYTHAIVNEANAVFIVPFDREDIHELAVVLDDVADFMHGAAKRINLYKPKAIHPNMIEIAKLIEKQCADLLALVKNLPELYYTADVQKSIAHIRNNEKKAEELRDETLSKLFASDDDVIEKIKIKEIITVLTRSADSAEVAASVVEGIMVKVS